MTETQVDVTTTTTPGNPEADSSAGRHARVRSLAGSVTHRGHDLGKRMHSVQLAHARPRSFAETWNRHQRVAQAHNAPVMRIPRYAWAAVHLTVFKPVLNLLEWLTESPLLFLVVAAAVAALILLI